MYCSPKYVAWQKHANGCWLEQKPKGRFPTITGKFNVHLKLSRPDQRRRDVDNYMKAVLDWAQQAGIISDDCNVMDNRTSWVTDEEAPTGAVLIITPC